MRDNTKTQWVEKEGRLVLPEQLTMNVLAAYLKKGGWLALPVRQVDFSSVIKADSAILAVLLVWNEKCEETLQVIGLPEELKTLIALYDLESAISLV